MEEGRIRSVCVTGIFTISTDFQTVQNNVDFNLNKLINIQSQYRLISRH